jgi:hypothetical protein
MPAVRQLGVGLELSLKYVDSSGTDTHFSRILLQRARVSLRPRREQGGNLQGVSTDW